MAGRTETEMKRALARDREHLDRWRSTSEGESDFQETVSRLRKLDESLRADD